MSDSFKHHNGNNDGEFVEVTASQPKPMPNMSLSSFGPMVVQNAAVMALSGIALNCATKGAQLLVHGVAHVGMAIGSKAKQLKQARKEKKALKKAAKEAAQEKPEEATPEEATE